MSSLALRIQQRLNNHFTKNPTIDMVRDQQAANAALRKEKRLTQRGLIARDQQTRRFSFFLCGNPDQNFKDYTQESLIGRVFTAATRYERNEPRGLVHDSKLQVTGTIESRPGLRFDLKIPKELESFARVTDKGTDQRNIFNTQCIVYEMFNQCAEFIREQTGLRVRVHPQKEGFLQFYLFFKQAPSKG